MSLTLLGWCLIVSSLAIAAFLVFPLRSTGSRGGQRDLESRGLVQGLRGTSRTLIVPAAVFLLVAGIGAFTSYVGASPEAPGAGDGAPVDDALLRLKDYTRSMGSEEPATTTAAGQLLPDVNTMIERLAARLEATPNDKQGWQMLGWSYFQTGRYEEAASAYARAVELDPGSEDLKRSYEEAKAKAAGTETLEAPSSLPTGTAGKEGDGAGVGETAKAEAAPSPAHDSQIRSMVDGLAERLEHAPRDVEGWTRLMRSRVVLGEKEGATAALRKALEVFRDDPAASSRIAAAAAELGLEAE